MHELEALRGRVYQCDIRSGLINVLRQLEHVESMIIEFADEWAGVEDWMNQR